MALNFTFKLIVWIISYTDILAFIIFLYTFLRKKDKNYGLLIIIILNFSYLLWSIVNVLAVKLALDDWNPSLVFGLYYGIANFSLCWSAAFAVFTYFVLKSRTLFVFKRFMILSFLICLGVSSIYPIL